MSNEVSPQVNGQPQETRRWAVVQFGIVSPSSGIVPFMNEQGKQMPQPIRLCNNQAEALKFCGRMTSLVSRITRFASDNHAKSTPIYGVAELVFLGQVGRKPMTEEQRKAAAERLAKGRAGRKGK